MALDDVIQKIPRPVLVLSVLALAVFLFVYNDPLKDECGIQITNFKKSTQGLLFPEKIKGKIQYPQINYWRDRCKEGNSIGSCEDYLEGLRVTARELKNVTPQCHLRLKEANPGIVSQLSLAVRIISLVAWGEKPPAGLSERMGWLNESHLRTFCYLKKIYTDLDGEEKFLALREKVYREYPGDWPDKFDVNQLVQSNSVPTARDPRPEVDVSKLIADNRPRAYKTAQNPSGQFTKEQIFERSLFSIRCDLYM